MKFLLITTGGTIASAPSEKGFSPDPSLSGEALLRACPLLMGFEHDLEIVNLFSKDSSAMIPSDWLEIAEAARTHTQDAVVVLHGTDTLAWTSSALSYLLRDAPFPLVLTGSMLPPGEPGTDAPENIYAAFQFALQLALYKRKGVSVAFSDLLIHGPRATKLDSRRKKAFVSVDYPLLGEMKERDGHKVAWLTPHSPAFPKTSLPWGKGSAPSFETRLAIVPVFPGMAASNLDAVLASGPKAVVLEGFGLGGIPCQPDGRAESLSDSIQRGLASGIPFILRTQSPFGGTDLTRYAVGQRVLDLGVIPAEEMTREALVTKLMLLLPLIEGESSRSDALEKYLLANFCDDTAYSAVI